jgi:hypothetical protein
VTPYRQLPKCRLHLGRAIANFFIEELCASSRVERWHLWAGDDPVRILGKGASQDLEFQKGYPKLIDEEPMWIMPNNMENLVRELPRDRDAFQKSQRRMYDRKA